LSVVAQVLRFFVSMLCACFLSLPALPLAAVNGKSRPRVLESVLKSVAGVVYQRMFSSLGRGDYSYDIELYSFTKMFAFAYNSEISFEVCLWSFISCNYNT
jgi:hypothetical protein